MEMEEAAHEFLLGPEKSLQLEELSPEEIAFNLDVGLFYKVDNHKEHFAIHPFWLVKPETGVMEELNKTLGNWNNKLKAYVVAFEKVRSGTSLAAINEDHQWLHVDVFLTFYLYKPEEGQKLRGMIKKKGNRAAICSVFNVFTATVFPQDDNEFQSWVVGAEIQFEMYSFENRRKGPILRARSYGDNFTSKNESVAKEDNWEEIEIAAKKYDEEENWEEDFDIPLEIVESSPPKKKKKKKDKSRLSEDLIPEVQDELIPKDKKKKKDKRNKSNISEEFEETEYPPVFSSEVDEFSPKKKRRIKQEIESDLEFQKVPELLLNSLDKKKKKHKKLHNDS